MPTEPAPYDLVVESDEGLSRIQVKSTITHDAGRWVVGISRKEYAAGVTNSGGARRQCVYKDGEIDFFFVVTLDGSQFLIPLGVTNGARWARWGLYLHWLQMRRGQSVINGLWQSSHILVSC